MTSPRANPSIAPAGEAPPPGEAGPADSARGDFKIVRGIAPGTLYETKDDLGK